MTVLIITFSQDNESIPLVTEAIEGKGGKVFRFDTDRYPTEVKVDLWGGEFEGGMIIDGDKQINLDDVSSVWYRRMRYGQKLPKDMESQYQEVARQECRMTIRGMISTLGGFHFDRMAKVDRANNKQLQLKIARQVGLITPKTLISNDPDAVRKFAQDCQEQGIITKMSASFAIYDENGQENVVFTNPVREDDLNHLEGLRFCPMTFQENVPKALELRTTIVGNQIFTAAIDSQKMAGSSFDWRKQGRDLVKDWQSYQLPEDIEEKLRKLMAYLGLNYGAIDLIVTPDSRYVFLEVNPVGEFFWMEIFSPYFPISQRIAEILMTGKN